MWMKQSLIIVLGSLFLVPANAGEKPKIREGKNPPIEVIRVNPSAGDLRKIKQRKQEGQEEQVHVVKLYVQMPPPGGEVHRLYIGDMGIGEYGSFSEGIFFKAYDRKELNAWRGQPVRFVFRDEVIDLGVLFPTKLPEPKPGKLPELEEVL